MDRAKLPSGVELTSVQTGASLETAASRGKPDNSYLDGKVRRGRGTHNVMNLKSTGYGPSKANIDESLPKLCNLEENIIVHLDQHGTVHLHMLASGVKEELERVESTIRSLTKRAILATSSRQGGGITLMAEGRRIAGLLLERRRR